MSAAVGAFEREREPVILPSRDRWETARRLFARVAALALHVLLFLSISLTPAVRTPPKEPPTIPVELVMEPPPPPKRALRPPPPKAQPLEQPQPKAQPGPQPDIPHVESGGSPALKSGAPAETKPGPPQEQPAEAKPQQAPQAPPAASPPTESPAAKAEAKPAAAPPTPTPAPALPLVEAPLPVAPPAQATAATKPAPAKATKENVQRPPTPPAASTANAPAATPPQVASLPPSAAPPKPPTTAPPGPATSELSAPKWSEGERRGEGGGDRYLNALRDTIISNLLYPASAHGTAGIVKYEIEMNRQGYMLRVAVVTSSGSPSLDRAGLDAIQNSMPFQPLPIRIQGDRVFILATLYIGPNGARSP